MSDIDNPNQELHDNVRYGWVMQASLPDGLHDDTLLEDLEDIRHDMLEAHRAWELATDEEDVPNIIQAGAKAADLAR